MQYSFSVPVSHVPPAVYFRTFSPVASPNRCEADGRWPRVLATLEGLRALGRRSIRIIDLNCGTGRFLMAIARRARALGFVAIEALGFDRDEQAIARARAAARGAGDPAIGLVFEHSDPRQSLQAEADFPADLILGDASAEDGRMLKLLAQQAGRSVVWAPAMVAEKAA